MFGEFCWLFAVWIMPGVGTAFILKHVYESRASGNVVKAFEERQTRFWFGVFWPAVLIGSFIVVVFLWCEAVCKQVQAISNNKAQIKKLKARVKVLEKKA